MSALAVCLCRLATGEGEGLGEGEVLGLGDWEGLTTAKRRKQMSVRPGQSVGSRQQHALQRSTAVCRVT